MIPTRTRDILSKSPLMTRCIHTYRDGHICKGRLTWEHSCYYAGKQIQNWWSIVPCCQSMNNDVHGLDKKYNQWVALQRASAIDVLKFPCKDWLTLARYLDSLFELTPQLNLAILRERDYLIQIGFKRENEIWQWWLPEIVAKLTELERIEQ